VITKWRAVRMTTLLMLIVGLLASVSCGDVARSGRAPAFLVIDLLTAASGATPGEIGNVLASDVETLVTRTVNGQQVPVATIFEDVGQATLRVLLKDQGNPGATAGPSNLNWLKVNRYRVVYKRADGRNTPGVDVPYPWDGAVTGSVRVGGSLSLSFEIVRHSAKQEAPLAGLVFSPTILTTITEVTFYGQDLVGNEISVTGTIQIDFGNFGDF